MGTEYVIEGYSNTVTVTGDFSTYPEIQYGEETTFEFYLQGDNQETAYQTLKDYQRAANKAAVNRSLGDVYYHTGSDFANTSIDSLLVKVTPGSDINQARGVWGVITNIDDRTEIFGSIAKFDVTVGVLADADEYATHNTVIDTFATDLTSDRRLLP